MPDPNPIIAPVLKYAGSRQVNTDNKTWAMDSHRAHWTCPTSELPEAIGRYLSAKSGKPSFELYCVYGSELWCAFRAMSHTDYVHIDALGDRIYLHPDLSRPEYMLHPFRVAMTVPVVGHHEHAKGVTVRGVDLWEAVAVISVPGHPAIVSLYPPANTVLVSSHFGRALLMGAVGGGGVDA
jgi:hypothetical protein